MRVFPSQKGKDMDFDTLFRYWYRPLCLFAMHYIDDIDQAEDIVQECYMVLWEQDAGSRSHTRSRKASEEICHVRDPKSYLYSMVRNRCLDLLRKESRRGEHVTIGTASAPESALGFHEEETWQDDSVREARMWTAIDSLPEKCREVFLLSKRDGMKYSDIAAHLNISENTVRNQISKALKVIKEDVRKIVAYLFGL